MTDPGQMRVLITGAGVRIGRQLAVSFARAGARVVVHYNRSEQQAHQLLEELQEISAGHDCVRADLLQRRERRSLIPEVLRRGGPLNCLVNNASVYRRCPLAKVDSRRLQLDYEINFMVPFLLMRDFATYCQEGNIINLLDQRVATVDSSASGYGFAKKSLRDATEAAAVQWAPRVRVNGVAPGLVMPPPGVSADKMQALLKYIPMAQSSAPEEVADACLFLARAKTITGQIIYVDGGMHLRTAIAAEVDEADYYSP